MILQGDEFTFFNSTKIGRIRYMPASGMEPARYVIRLDGDSEAATVVGQFIAPFEAWIASQKTAAATTPKTA